MPTLFILIDLPEFEYRYVYEGDRTERAKLQAHQRGQATKAGIGLREYLESAVTNVIRPYAPHLQEGAIHSITAWALGLPSGHPTHGTIDDYLDGYDFVVTITANRTGKVECWVEAGLDEMTWH